MRTRAVRSNSSHSVKKTYVLDTNVLLHDCQSIFSFDDNDVILPMTVLEELDNHKSRQDEVGANARKVCRLLDALRDQGSLLEGVQLPGKGKIRVQKIESNAVELLPVELSRDKNDHLIMALMIELQKGDVPKAILVSKDINVRIKCDALGIRCEDYRHARAAKNVSEIYTGVTVVSLHDELIARFFSDGWLSADCIGTFHPNEIVVLKSESGDGTTLTRCIQRDDRAVLIALQQIDNAFGLAPRNKEQSFALDLLYDADVKLVTLTGRAGSGKSIIALASALDQLKGLGNKGVYDKLIVMRPIQAVGKEMGFLPGTLDEKLAPWVAPIEDGLNFLMGTKRVQRRGNRHIKNDENEYLKLYQDNGLIEIAAITFMRGRSIPNAIIIIDEGQNLSLHEVKTLITRVGEGTKVIITGDVEQIDHPHLDSLSNGLTCVIEKFKNHSIAGHITFLKGERSELASLAADIL